MALRHDDHSFRKGDGRVPAGLRLDTERLSERMADPPRLVPKPERAIGEGPLIDPPLCSTWASKISPPGTSSVYAMPSTAKTETAHAMCVLLRTRTGRMSKSAPCSQTRRGPGSATRSRIRVRPVVGPGRRGRGVAADGQRFSIGSGWFLRGTRSVRRPRHEHDHGKGAR